VRQREELARRGGGAERRFQQRQLVDGGFQTTRQLVAFGTQGVALA
jgi:hypothetical protein